jgi:hypothetical protein
VWARYGHQEIHAICSRPKIEGANGSKIGRGICSGLSRVNPSKIQPRGGGVVSIYGTGLPLPHDCIISKRFKTIRSLLTSDICEAICGAKPPSVPGLMCHGHPADSPSLEQAKLVARAWRISCSSKFRSRKECHYKLECLSTAVLLSDVPLLQKILIAIQPIPRLVNRPGARIVCGIQCYILDIRTAQSCLSPRGKIDNISQTGY